MVKIEIKKKEKNHKDIFYKGNLVISKWNIVLVESDSIENFSGQAIYSEKESAWPVGYRSSTWDKASFTQFVGTITITSE